jgi:glucose-1-phosphate adenylyltransferase
MHSSAGIASRTTTFVLASEANKRLIPLTSGKVKPLVPFGGLFRIVDFTLSNCDNSGIEHAYIVTGRNSNLMRRYIESASWKTELLCLPPLSPAGYRGTADALYQNLNLFCRNPDGLVLVLPSDHIYKMDYRKLLRFHAAHGGDATVAAIPRVQSNMGIYVFSVAALRRALLRDAVDSLSSHDLAKDILPQLIQSDRVVAYDFTAQSSDLGSYWREIDSIDSYYRSQMELLVMNSPFDPYTDARWPAYAGGRVLPPISTGLEDSFISRNSHVSSSAVLKSVIASEVEISGPAHIERSVLMRGVRVGRWVKLRRVIVNEGASIPDGETIGFDIDKDCRRFHVTEGGVVIVQAGTIPAGRASTSFVLENAPHFV